MEGIGKKLIEFLNLLIFKKRENQFMSNNLSAWILTIGNEIINGVITDTNRETIARELRAVGISIRGMSSVGDKEEEIVEALRYGMGQADLTICSGGLGPTEDDKTAAGAAMFQGVSLELNEEQLQRIKNRFEGWGRPMSPSNAKQAMLPLNSIAIPNDYGTAPGFAIGSDNQYALFFPGIPRELVQMLREQGLPLVWKLLGDSGKVFKHRTVIVYGLSESRLGEILSDIAQDTQDSHLAFLPRFPVIRLRIDASGLSEKDADDIIKEKLAQIRTRIPENIISEDGLSIEKVMIRLLEERNMTLTLAESITGGLIGEMLTRVSGSSRSFMGSIVSYSNELKTDLLKVPTSIIEEHGAVSHECARFMALGARLAGRSTIGLSVTGIAGPDGGSDEKPIGTFFIGMSTEEHLTSRRYLMPGMREWVKNLAAMQALDLLRRNFLGLRLHGQED